MADINMIAENVIFFIFATVAIGGAFFLIKAPKVAHSMVALIFCFTAIAGVFILVGAEFLASIQIFGLPGQCRFGCSVCNYVDSETNP